jgi:hypothetical protein
MKQQLLSLRFLLKLVLCLAGNMQTMFHATADDEVLKGSFASVSSEHYEMSPPTSR